MSRAPAHVRPLGADATSRQAREAADLALLRETIAHARRLGLPFAEAWRTSLAAMRDRLNADTRDALHDTRDAWERAYNREGPAGLADALDVLDDLTHLGEVFDAIQGVDGLPPPKHGHQARASAAARREAEAMEAGPPGL